jgi:demethylmenaquinone methyltransferase/2-methoxy-6-polyprenyl-1,4-benzoquinol methylase
MRAPSSGGDGWFKTRNPSATVAAEAKIRDCKAACWSSPRIGAYYRGMSAPEVLQDQIAYYRARAGEYDEWWFRSGRYDRGLELNARWHAETAQVEAALQSWLALRRPRTLLEVACGTGLFTRHLAPRVERVTAVDASPEVLAINRSRVAATNVEYIEADLFAWTPPERYDAAFFSFWLSHVPQDRFDGFWRMVASALMPGGAAFLIDSAFDRTSTAKDHVLERRDAGVVARKLNDGREFRIVKIFYEPHELAAKLAGLGWTSSLQQTARYFIHGEANPPL